MFQNDYIHIDSLVNKVKDNNTDALWELFDFYQPIIRSCVSKVNKKYKTIQKEDLISECAFILKDLCNKYDQDKSYFSYYFNTRLQPYLIAKIKSKYLEKNTVISLSTIEEYEHLDQIEILEESTILDEAIKGLPDNLKQIIDLFYFKNLTQSECAVILNISQPAFSKKLKTALAKIKKNIKD